MGTSMRVLILTANIGGKDKLQDPIFHHNDCDYIAITDKKDPSLKVWDQREYINFSSIDKYKDRRNAKYSKILSPIIYSEYDYIVWHDANHNLMDHPKMIINSDTTADMFLFKHPHRSCAYQELQIVTGLDNVSVLQEQFNWYLSDKSFPPQYGLYEMTCYVQAVNHKTKELSLRWWEQVCKYSSRDQCSFMFSLWQMTQPIKIKVLQGFANVYAGGNPYFSEQPGHLK
jgi:hypothetical protein